MPGSPAFLRKPFSPRDFTPELEHLLGGAGRQRLSHLIREVVAQRGDQVEVAFDRPSRIGNFGRMVVRLDLGAIQEIQGGHPTAGVLRV